MCMYMHMYTDTCLQQCTHVPSHPHSCVPLVEQERYVELVGRVRADKLEAERMREVAKKRMDEAEVKCSLHLYHCTCIIHSTAHTWCTCTIHVAMFYGGDRAIVAYCV